MVKFTEIEDVSFTGTKRYRLFVSPDIMSDEEKRDPKQCRLMAEETRRRGPGTYYCLYLVNGKGCHEYIEWKVSEKDVKSEMAKIVGAIRHILNY